MKRYSSWLFIGVGVVIVSDTNASVLINYLYSQDGAMLIPATFPHPHAVAKNPPPPSSSTRPLTRPLTRSGAESDRNPD